MLIAAITKKTFEKILRKKQKIRNQADFLAGQGVFYSSFVFSAVNYYILAGAVSIAAFFIIWGILHGGEGETPWITSGIIASLILIGSVIYREVVFRKNTLNMQITRERLDSDIKNVYKTNNSHQENRLTIERNAQVLKKIELKSRSVKSITQNSAPHLEVFELCESYLQKSSRELSGMLKGSPRFSVLTKGQKKVRGLHRFHLLAWASIESQFFLQNSKVHSSVNEKIENANRALEVINSARQFYPDENKLSESAELVEEFIVSTRVSHWIEQAERAAFKENYQRAINHYKDALFFLARENKRTPDRELLAEKINSEIEEIRNKLSKGDTF